MFSYIKVLLVLVCVILGPSLGDRLNHKRWEWPSSDVETSGRRGGPNPNNQPIVFGDNRSNAHSPPHHSPPDIPIESERIEAPPLRPTPSPVPVTLPPRPKSKPACAANLECDSPCERDEEYNSTIRARIDALINESILNDPILETLLKEVVIPEEDAPSVRGGIIESPVCAGQETIFFPERAKTENDDWAFVLNQGKVKQGIKYEKCIKEGNKCNLGAAGSEIETVCRQKYIFKKMLVMDGQGSKILPEQVLMPSCCICYIKTPFNFGRAGARRDGCH